MNYTDVQNPTWNKERTAINCVVVFDALGAVPFSAVPNDRYQHVVEIYQRCLAGEFGPIADYVPAPDEGGPELEARLALDGPSNGAQA